MSSKYSDESRIIRCYSVTDPTLHRRGHTIYKVVEKVGVVVNIAMNLFI